MNGKPRPAMYRRPDKPLFVAIPKRDWRERQIPDAPAPKPVEVWAGTECHVTPPEIARRMADYLGRPGRQVLEPSAGTGSLFRALLEAGHAPGDITMVEMHHALAGALQALGNVVCADFLDFARTCERKFDQIIMNPPFRKARQHVAAARALLEPGGTLVALVPVTFEAEGMETLETLPADTFELAKVYTKIITNIA